MLSVLATSFLLSQQLTKYLIDRSYSKLACVAKFVLRNAGAISPSGMAFLRLFQGNRVNELVCVVGSCVYPDSGGGLNLLKCNFILLHFTALDACNNVL